MVWEGLALTVNLVQTTGAGHLSPVNIIHNLSDFDIKHSIPSIIILTDGTCPTMSLSREGDERPFVSKILHYN